MNETKQNERIKKMNMNELKQTNTDKFNVTPTVYWSIDPFGSSSVVPYLNEVCSCLFMFVLFMCFFDLFMFV